MGAPPPAQVLRLSPEARTLIDELLAMGGSNRAVAFDADGTLWRGDIGEELLRYLAAEGRLPTRRGQGGVYEEYERRVERDPAAGYAYAVEVMEDLEESHLRSACEEFYQRRFAGRLFPFVRPLILALVAAGYRVWVVSASPSWAVVPGAVALGVARERIIGVHCSVVAGRLTGPVDQPIPCGEGKVALLKQRGVRPVLAVGNGELDEPMLAYAERALVIAPHGEDNGLVRAARARRWPVQRG